MIILNEMDVQTAEKTQQKLKQLVSAAKDPVAKQKAKDRYMRFVKRKNSWIKAPKSSSKFKPISNPQSTPANNQNTGTPTTTPANNQNTKVIYRQKKHFFDKTAQRGRIAGKKALRFASNNKVGVGLAGAGLLAAGAYGIHRYNQKKKEEAAAKQQTPQQQHTFLNKFGRI